MIYLNNRKIYEIGINKIGGEGKCEVKSNWRLDGTICKGVDLYNKERLQYKYADNDFIDTNHTRLGSLIEADCENCKIPKEKIVTLFNAKNCEATDGSSGIAYKDTFKNIDYIADSYGVGYHFHIVKNLDNSIKYVEDKSKMGFGNIKANLGSIKSDVISFMFKFKNESPNLTNHYIFAGPRNSYNELYFENDSTIATDFLSEITYNFEKNKIYEIYCEVNIPNKTSKFVINGEVFDNAPERYQVSPKDLSDISIFSNGTSYKFLDSPIYYFVIADGALTKQEQSAVKSYIENN